MTGSFQDDKRFIRVVAELERVFGDLVDRFESDELPHEAAINQVSSRLRTLIGSAWEPVLDEDGYIPPVLVCSESEVIHWFGRGSRRREKLLERIKNWIRLANAVKARRLLLDGSFVTAKTAPGDVDAAILLPVDFWDQLEEGRAEAVELRQLFVTRTPKELFAADTEEDWWDWVEFFSRTREPNRRRKGLIEVQLVEANA